MVAKDSYIRAVGSRDHATQCLDIEETCMSDDLSIEYNGTECDHMGFSLLPLGRQASNDHIGISGQAWPASKLISNISNLVNIDYSPNNQGNSIKFGPDTISTSLTGRHFGPDV